MNAKTRLLAVPVFIIIPFIVVSCIWEPSDNTSMLMGIGAVDDVVDNEVKKDEYNLCSEGPHVFLPETFHRNQGEPGVETRAFYVPLRTKACVVVANDGISAAWIKVDGSGVFGPSSFNPAVTEITDTIVLDEGEHELSVRLTSKPGAKLSVEIRIGMEITIDSTVEPPFEALPDFFTGETVPLAAVSASEGSTLSYASNQIILLTDFESELQNIIQNYDGEILYEVDYRSMGIELPNGFLIRVNPHTHTLATFEQDLAANIEEFVDGAKPMGELRFSSEEGALLMSILATEVRAGLSVGINHLERPDGFAGGWTIEALEERPSHPNYVRDAYQWDYLAKGNAIDTGAAEAWSLLYHLGLLENISKRRIGIIDAGFHEVPGGDIPAYDTLAIGNETVIGTRNHWPGHDWHGQRVAMTATAVPDNNFGTAGTGGPVAKPLYVHASPWGGLNLIFIMPACVWHSDICNMSGSADIPWWASWATYPVFDPVSAACSYGGLLLASAGNEGKNNNRKTCAPPFDWPCWESVRKLPCEAVGVQCIGGVGRDGCKDPSSNWGDVDLWAPYNVYVGWNPDLSNEPPVYENYVERAGGNSHSTPFVAGAVATVWRACRDCDFDDVFNILQETSHESPSSCGGYMHVNRIIDVFDAVLTTRGFEIQAEIVSPSDGSVVDFNRPYSFIADLKVFSLSGDPFNLAVIWESDLDGPLAAEYFEIDRQLDLGVYKEQSNLEFSLSEGEHEIKLTAFFWGQPALRAESTIHVTAINSAPHSIRIVKPDDGREFCEGEQILFLGEARDWNQDLTDFNFEWLSTIQPGQRFGVGRELVFDGMVSGDHTIQLLVTDDHNETGTDYVYIRVLPATDPDCLNLPPYVRIIQPSQGNVFFWMGYDGIYPFALLDLIGEARDPENPDDDLSVEWRSDLEPGILGSTLLVEDAMFHIWTPPYTIEKHDITLTAVDIDGKEGSDTISVYILGPED
ncbi:S8 family serine peptidase [Myxococcota bacterium]